MLLNELQNQQHTLEEQAQQLLQLKAGNIRLQVAAMEQNADLAARLERLEAAEGNGDAGFELRLSSLANAIKVRQP